MKSRGRIQCANPVENPGRSEGLRSHRWLVSFIRMLDRIVTLASAAERRFRFGILVTTILKGRVHAHDGVVGTSSPSILSLGMYAA